MIMPMEISDPIAFIKDMLIEIPRDDVIQLVKDIDNDLMRDWNFTQELHEYFENEMKTFASEEIRGDAPDGE